MFLVSLIIAIVGATISYLLAPRPKTSKPKTVQEFKEPTAEVGRPIPVVFGTVFIESPNILWYGEKKIDGFNI